MRKRFIFVTGHPRSGTTFVGNMLALPKTVQYFTEPFNPNYGIPEVEDFYIYTSRNKDQSALKMMGVIDNFYIGKAKFRTLDPKLAISKKQYLGRKIFGTKNNFEYKKFLHNPTIRVGLIKDPTACLSTGYIANQKDTPTIILIRHPAAVIGSAKRLGWDFHLNKLMDNNTLHEEFGNKIIEDYNINNLNKIQRQAVHWLIINTALLSIHKNSANTLMFTHEEISAHPNINFKKMYDFCNLKYSKRVQKSISLSTSKSNPTSAKNNAVHQLNRNSKANIKGFKKILSEKEINQIKEITYDFASKFYNDDSWR